jgi:dipeptidyl aminopeptidase/acylaminoacyl peptidase
LDAAGSRYGLRMRPQDIARVVSVSDPAVAPDGRTVAVTVGGIDLDANRGRSAVWLVPVDGGPARQLTAGPADSGARWSPDGTQLAFVRHVVADAGGEGSDTLLVLGIGGPGEPVPVASSPEAITDVDWSPDGERLAWCTRVRDEGATAPDREREPRRIDVLLTTLDNVGWTVDRRKQAFVGRVDGTEPARQVTSGPFDHDGVRWSPDGRTLVVAAGRHPGWDVDEVVDLYLVDPDVDPAAATDGDRPAGAAAARPPEPRRLTAGGRMWSHPSWSPDGTRIAGIAVDASGGFRNARPLVVDVATGAEVDAAPAVDRSFAPYPSTVTPQWLDAATFLVAREDRGRVGVLRVRADGTGTPDEVAGGERVVAQCNVRGGTIALVSTTTSTLPELSVLTEGGEVPRTRFGDAFLRTCPPRTVERFTVPSPAGGEIDAWFVHPDGFGTDGDRGDGGARTWPLLVSIHGGPATQYGERWFDEFQLWASAGFAVVGCNPHGSSGRDEAWGRALRSPLAEVDPGSGWGGVDADDVVAVLDATLGRWPALDPERVGVLGGSYGGYLTSWLLGRTDRFAAGCSERAVNNLLSEDWSCDIKGGFDLELGVSILDHPEEYLRMSPATYARDITAPVLIIHSEDDLRCNIEQADALFVPLRRLGREVEYWRFPGEGHEMSRSGAPRHRIRRAEIIIDFFTRHLGGARPAPGS